jgi:hypothetical protein
MDIMKQGGGYLLDSYYDGSIKKALQRIYPDMDWLPWRFQRSNYYSRDATEESKFLGWLEDRYNINTPLSWNSITKDRFIRNQYGRSILSKYGGSLLELLRFHRPLEKWEVGTWTLHNKSQSQILLSEILRSILSKDMEMEYDAHFSLMEHRGNHPVQLDIWIPYFNLAIEYQGVQHYIEDGFVHGDATMTNMNRRDRMKEDICNRYHISLIVFPFWWNLDVPTVQNIIDKVEYSFMMIDENQLHLRL